MKILFPFVFPLVLLAPSAWASTTLVPDDYPTIQQAIDSGPDTVIVKEGTYDEDLTAPNDLVLLAYSPLPSTRLQFNAPVVRGLSASADIVAEGLRFTGPVTVANGQSFGGAFVRFEACRFDAALATGNSQDAFLYVRGCMFLIDSHVIPYSCEFVNNTFINASLDVGYEGFARYIGNVFVGSGAFGLRTSGSQTGVTISGNLVSGRVDGIVVLDPWDVDVTHNTVEDCSGDGFKVEGPAEPLIGSIDFTSNRVHNCSGDAFDLDRSAGMFVGNVVDSVGGDGLRWSHAPMHSIIANDIRHVGGKGIAGGAVAFALSRNTILDAGSDGIAIEYATRADSNVIGRAGAKGLWISDGYLNHIGSNTIYLCASDGFFLNSAGSDTLTNNIAYANGGAGFAFTGGGTPVLACNDWHANTGGATSGVAPGATDINVDPLFCNVAADDMQLSAASPLLDAAGCGQIGALGEGCTASVSVGPGAGGEAFALHVFPLPTRNGVTFSWSPGAGAANLEVFDVTGARHWSATAPAGSHSLTWDLGDARGDRLPPGVYWARVAAGGQIRTSRLVIIE